MLTREQIMSMPAGREMDAEIARMMGWTDFSPIDPTIDYGIGVNGYRRNYATDPEGRKTWFPFFSNDISAAWEVVEALNGKYSFTIQRLGDYFYQDPDYGWEASFGGYPQRIVIAETAPLAICRAALLAVIEHE